MDKREYACFKRCLEWYQAAPQYRLDMERAPEFAVKILGFDTLLDAKKVREAIRQIVMGIPIGQPSENPYIQAYSEHFARVGAFVKQSHARSRFATEQLCRFADTSRNRCRMESRAMRSHDNVYYYPLCFELSSGCRVQCKFCGLAAKPFSGNFLYTEENRALWRSILQISKEAIGEILQTSICYFATEPMDNPDYERFMLDHREITGGFSQITTALADRHANRLRTWMQILGEETMQRTSPLRFSICSLAQFFRIVNQFSPEELAYVELLPNNPESLLRYADSGKVDSETYAPDKCMQYSISCIAGLRVNMVERTIAFIEPELPDAEFPLGYRQREIRTFTDAESYTSALYELLDRYAIGTLPRERPLCFNKNIRMEEADGALFFRGDGCYYRLAAQEMLIRAVAAIHGGATFSEIAAELTLNPSAAENLYTDLNKLFVRGYLRLQL